MLVNIQAPLGPPGRTTDPFGGRRPPARVVKVAPPRPREQQGFGLIDVFVFLFGLRMISEGIDLYAKTQMSVAVTVCLIVISVIAIATSGRISARSGWVLLMSLPFLASASVSFALNWTYSPAQQGAQIVKYIAFVLIFMVAASTHWTRAQVGRFFTVLILAMGLQLLASVYQVGSGRGYTDETFTASTRAFGLTSHPVYFGINCVALLILTVAFRGALTRQRVTIFAAILSLCLALTYARSAWLMLLIWGGVLLLRSAGLAVRAFIVFIAGPIVIWLMIASGRLDDLASVPQFIASRGYESWDWRTATSSAEWRLVQWFDLLRFAWQTPWIGHGLRSAAGLGEFHRSSHNSFLDAFLDQGLIGLGTFILMLSSIFTATKRRLRVRALSPVLRRRMATNRIAIWASYLLAMNFGGSVFDSTLSMAIFFLFLGLSVNPTFFRYCEPAQRRAGPAGPPPIVVARGRKPHGVPGMAAS
jgi:O-antigen ligase